MSESQSPPASLLLLELKRWAEGLKPGGAEALAGLWGEQTAQMTSDRIAEFVAERMMSPDADEIDPHRRRLAPLELVGRSPLIAALHRRRFELRPPAPDQLFRLWRLELRGLSAAKVAGEVARRLDSPEYALYVKTDDPEALAFDRAYRVVARFADDLILGAPLDLTHKWYVELERLGRPAKRVEAVAARLALPSFAGLIKPGRKLPTTAEEALAAALRRYPELVPSSAVPSLVNGWKPLAAALSLPGIAGFVCEKLGAPN